MELVELFRNMELIQMLILLAGLVLVIVEMFHPGFGAPGIAGGLLLLAGIIITSKGFIQALFLLLIILCILGAALAVVLHSATRGKLKQRLILNHSQHNEDGYVGTDDLQGYLGKEGIVLTVLRPSGSADFDGVRLDVVSEGTFINPGTPIRVMKVEGRRIVVIPAVNEENQVKETIGQKL